MGEVCDHCGRPGETLRRCTGCWNVRYCSPDCQRRHWPRHKGACVRRAASVVTSATAEKGEKGEEKGTGKKTPKASSAQKTPPPATKKEADGDGKDGGDRSTLQGPRSAVTSSVCKMCKTRLPSTVVKCARCQDVTYCSRDCRRADWLTHVGTCVPVVDRTVEDREKTVSKDEDEADKPEREGSPPLEAGGGEETEGTDASASRPELTDEAEKDEEGKTCQKCKAKKTGMKRCGRCLEVMYCSRDCQRADWSAHKVTCQPVEALTTDGYRETVRKEKAARQRVANDLANLLGHPPRPSFYRHGTRTARTAATTTQLAGGQSQGLALLSLAAGGGRLQPSGLRLHGSPFPAVSGLAGPGEVGWGGCLGSSDHALLPPVQASQERGGRQRDECVRHLLHQRPPVALLPVLPVQRGQLHLHSRSFSSSVR